MMPTIHQISLQDSSQWEKKLVDVNDCAAADRIQITSSTIY